jgi:hypothetical protein
MKPDIKKALFTLAIAALTGAPASAQTAGRLPSTDDVVAKMMEADAARQSQMTGYIVLRRYVAMNKNRHAEMLVRVECDGNGAEHFSIVSEEGSSAIRNHVFRKLLKEEEEASRHGTRKSTRLTPENYNFAIIAKETVETGPAYVLAVSPKSVDKYSIAGNIWVDANDYSIVRIEGQPARSPSFWVHSVHFVHTYEKVGPFWLASSTRTRSEIRIFGDAELTIENTDYTLDPPVDHMTVADDQSGSVQ